MKEETLRKVEELDREYFGNRSLGRLVRAISAQVESMEKDRSLANVHKQAGDLLFVLVALARNNSWDLDELLEGAVQKLEYRRCTRHYYESHVTIEPVFEERLELLRKIGPEYGFHVATLLMKKRPQDTAERSQNDSFCTARGISYSDLKDRTIDFVKRLQDEGFTAWRYKIESTLLDSRYDDSLLPLDRKSLPEKERNPRAPADGALPGRHEP